VKRVWWRTQEKFSATFVGFLVAGLVMSGCVGTEDEAGSDTNAGGGAGEEGTAGDQASGNDDALPVDGATASEADIECPAVDGSSSRVTNFAAAPPMCLDLSATYVAQMQTNHGPITIELFPDLAPVTVNNFVFLARHHYYDGVAFHRIIPGFVIQGGDAVGNPPGTGGPGYTISEEPPAPGAYQIGSLVMAKTPAPNSTGSQFFIITGPNGATLPNEYSLFGQVTTGLDVVQAIEQTPTDGRDFPIEPATIESITIVAG